MSPAHEADAPQPQNPVQHVYGVAAIALLALAAAGPVLAEVPDRTAAGAADQIPKIAQTLLDRPEAAPQTPSTTQETPAVSEPRLEPGLFEREALTGNWGGLRSRLSDAGVQLGFNYIGETLGNLAGGVRHGWIYEGRFELVLDVDLEKAIGWSGARFHTNAYQIHGRGLTADRTGNLLTASGIEATRATRLYTLWLEQNLFEDRLSLRAGQLAADDEFITSQYAATFVNSTFGWPAITALDLPNGGPAYPLATPGFRVRVSPTEALSLSGAVFNGDPAGRGDGNPQDRNASGTSFRLNDDVFAIVELAYARNQKPSEASSGLPGTFKLGGWYHSGRFPDQRFDVSGLSLADPASSGDPARRGSNFGVYAVIDQMVWRRPDTEDQGLGVFARIAGSPSDRNLVSFYADGGINYKGLVPSREADVLGVAFGYARLSGDARRLDRDAAAFAGTGLPVRDFEAVLEVTYQAQITPWLTVQPDLQYVFHPGGGGANPADPSGASTIHDAFIAGVRAALRL